MTTGTEGKNEMTDRGHAPKADDYSVVPGSLGPRRDFRISVGLREGRDAAMRCRPAGNQTAPFAVPRLTSMAGIKLNFQVSLRHRHPALSIGGDRAGG